MLFARRIPLLLLVVVTAVNCATHGGRVPSANADDGSSSTVVTAKELARVGQHGSLMDALERLRPVMVAGRGAVPRVSVDGSPPGELALLRTIQASAVREVRLERSSSSVGLPAVVPNGEVIVGDVIVVTTWPAGHGRP